MEYGLLGKKLCHSFSKEIHNLIGNYDYQMIEKDENEVEAFLTQKDFKAINVTIPYKEAVMPYLYKISDNALQIGSVNTIVNRENKLFGYNTDFVGFSELLDRAGIDVSGRKVLIFGTGGTSKTAFSVCKAKKAGQIYKVSRNADENSISYEQAYSSHTDAQIIINTTPVGMYPKNGESIVDIEKFTHLQAVADVIYNPLETALLQDAKKKHLKYTNGLYMLVRQAVAASELFFDKKYNNNKSEEIYKKVLSQKQNIVLTGMPSSGKTTIGKQLAVETKREFVDTDDVIVKNTGMSISDIFAKYGEKKFRDIETKIVCEASQKSGLIIATGGGCVLKKENIDFLKQNGKIYFLDRPLEKLIPTGDRPTADSIDKIKKLFENRYEIYQRTADEKIKVTDDFHQAQKEIERRHGL